MDIVIPPEEKRRWPRWAWGLVAAAALVPTLFLLRPAKPAVPKEQLVLGELRRGTMPVEVAAYGTLRSQATHVITAPAPGRVVAVLANPGARVAAGDVLCQLANPALEESLRQAESELSLATAQGEEAIAALAAEEASAAAAQAQARAQLAQARRVAEAKRALSQGGLVSQLDLAGAEGELAALEEAVRAQEHRVAALAERRRAATASHEARMRQKTSAVQALRAQVAALAVRSEVFGVVEEVRVEPGAWVESGQVLGRVSDPRSLEAVLAVAASDASSLRPGLPVRLQAASQEVKGVVKSLEPTAKEGMVQLVVGAEQPWPPGVFPGQRVEAVVELAELANVLFLPAPPGAKPETTVFLYRLSGEREAQRVEVRLGSVSKRWAEVRAGLEAGDKVILSGTDGLESPEIRLH
jgi:HlyD family secretion protein